MNNKRKRWDLISSHDSVAILLFEPYKSYFLLVKQFRPPVFINNTDGYTYELCAGIVDKNKPLKEIIQEEAIEECGYDLKLKDIKKISSFYTSVGITGSKQSVYFSLIDEKKQKPSLEAETIELIKIPLKEAKKFIYNEEKPKTAGLIFSFQWFFENIAMPINKQPKKIS